ncbi:MAG: hypothetical protein U9N35_06420 [Euryarchaeota archaeon]|nr:hypothetical protein [Euryarchaeota archaeon]
MSMKDIVKKVALIDSVILIAVTAIYIFRDWLMVYYVNALTVAGAAVICTGILSLLGLWGLTRNFKYQYASSAGSQSMEERTQQSIEDIELRYGSFIVFSIAGIVLILSAVLIDIFFG